MEQLYLVNRFTAENEVSADESKPIDPDRRLKKILKRAKKRQEQARLSHDTQVADDTSDALLTEAESSSRKRKIDDLDAPEQPDDDVGAPKKKGKPASTKSKTKVPKETGKEDALEGVSKADTTMRKKKRRKRSKLPRLRALDAQHERSFKVQAKTKKTKTGVSSRKKNKESDEEPLKSEDENATGGNTSPPVGDMACDVSESLNGLETGTTPSTPVEYFPVLGEVEVKAAKVVHRVLPDWLSNPETIESRVKKGKTSANAKLNNFHDSLSPEMLTALAANKIRRLFPVQEKVVPWLMSPAQRRCFLPPRDICVSAPTGSGKTLAYVIPIVESLKPRIVRAVRAVVVLPVKELAAQVHAVFQQYLKGTSLRCQLVTGTKPFSEEQSSLVHKNARGYASLVDILVATPGRLLDHIRRTPGFSLRLLKFFVLDEADRVIEDVRTTLIPEVEQAVFGAEKCNCCCGRTSSNGRLYTQPLTVCSLQHCREPAQKLLYSATLTQDPEKLQSLMLFQPKLFTAAGKDDKQDLAAEKATSAGAFAGKYTTPQGLSEFYCITQNAIKPLALWDLVANRGYSGTLCFTGTKDDAHRLCLVIKEMGGVRVEEFSSDLGTTERGRVLRKFASGGLDLLVCSNVLARGLDVTNVRNVVCYDPPKYIKTYVHRVGRTARAGVPGTAVTFLRQGQLEAFQAMLGSAGKPPIEALKKGESGLEVFHEKYRAALKAVEEAVGQEKKDVQSGKKLKYARKNQLPRSAFGKKALGRGAQ